MKNKINEDNLSSGTKVKVMHMDGSTETVEIAANAPIGEDSDDGNIWPINTPSGRNAVPVGDIIEIV